MKETPGVETETIRMSLCNARAMWAAAGSYNCGGIPGTCSILHRPSLPTAREDQVARRIPAKRGTIALRVSTGFQGRKRTARACVNYNS